MTVNGINGVNTGLQAVNGMGGAMDSACRDIQRQIEQAQKRLSDLSSNEEMPLEEKMKKRQEIQKEITELNQQLRQRQIEARQQAQQQKEQSGDKRAGSGNKVQNGPAKSNGGMSGAGMQAMISADISMKQAQVQGNAATQMEGRANILESEIKMDKSRGSDTAKKEEELADLRQNIQDASSSQIETLTDANKTMKESARTQRESKEDEAKEAKEEKNQEDSDARLQIIYTPVDIRL